MSFCVSASALLAAAERLYTYTIETGSRFGGRDARRYQRLVLGPNIQPAAGNTCGICCLNLPKVAPALELSLVLPPHIQAPGDLPDSVRVIATGKASRSSKFGKVRFEQHTFPKAAKSVNADIAHVPYWGTPLTCPVKLVTTVLDIIPLQYPIYNRGLFTSLYTSLVSTAARGSAHIITISESSKLDIEEHLRIPEKRYYRHLPGAG